jgi:hypothetical protein
MDEAADASGPLCGIEQTPTGLAPKVKGGRTNGASR